FCTTGTVFPIPGDGQPTVANLPIRWGGSGTLLEPLHEEGALDLPGRGRAGERIDDCQPARLLEPREAPLTMSAEPVDGQRRAARPGDDDRGHDFAPLDVGNADDGHLHDVRMSRADRFDLGGRDGLATRSDDVACATDDRHVAVVVHDAQVTRVVPAVD